MRIFLTGDTHGIGGFRRFDLFNRLVGSGLIKEDYLVVLGDFGCPFNNTTDVYNYQNEIKALEKLSEMSWTTLFVDGNHENFTNLKNLPEVEFLGGKAGQFVTEDKKLSIYHLKRGEIYNFEGMKAFCFGGAFSIDRSMRILGHSYWEEEEASYQEISYAENKLDSVNWQVDLVLTHTGPTSLTREAWYRDQREEIKDRTADWFDNVYRKLNFDQWFFGHHHRNSRLNSKLTCLYYKIVEVKLEDSFLVSRDVIV